MRTPLLTEEQHRKYLQLFLDEAKFLKIEGLADAIKGLAPYARDCLGIARDVGYVKLYEEFEPAYKSIGL